MLRRADDRIRRLSVVPIVLRSLLGAGVATALVVGGGLLLTLDDRQGNPVANAPTPAPVTTTPLAEIDTDTLTVPRSAFCDLVPDDVVVDALGSEPKTVRTYGNGESAKVTKAVSDIAHEFGCWWVGESAVVARAWVFAPPVTVRQARALGREVAAARGCERQRPAPSYGRRSVVLVCDSGKALQASYRGLYGDAWLTCSLTARLPRAALLERAEQFCGAVVLAASTPAD